MKVGIFTLPLENNYGGVLQAYALSEFLKSIGHEVYLIDSNNKAEVSQLKYSARIIKRIIKRYVLGNNIEIFSERRKKNEVSVVNINFIHFIKKHFPNQWFLDNNLELITNLDAIVVGSDQIWRPKYYYKIENAFLSFLEHSSKVKRIAYAPSFGTDKCEYADIQKLMCSQLLSKFDAISVREDSAVNMVEDFFGQKAQHVLDPTMIVDLDVYTRLFKGKKEKYNGKGITYILDSSSDKLAVVNKVSELLGFEFVAVNEVKGDWKTPSTERVLPSIEEWLQGFYESDYVITDSFHACVFAILFNKPFIVYGNIDRGSSRFLSLLKMFDLEDRLIFDFKALSDNIIYSDINWNSVQGILIQNRLKSQYFLSEALS